MNWKTSKHTSKHVGSPEGISPRGYLQVGEGCQGSKWSFVGGSMGALEVVVVTMPKVKVARAPPATTPSHLGCGRLYAGHKRATAYCHRNITGSQAATLARSRAGATG